MTVREHSIDYETGWFRAIERVWQLCESLELKYGEVPAITELTALLLENRQPPGVKE